MDHLAAYTVRLEAESAANLRQSPLYSLLPVRTRQFWRPDAVGALVAAGDGRTLMVPLGCAVVSTGGPTGSAYVAWGFVDASVRVVAPGEPEGLSGDAKVPISATLPSTLACMCSAMLERRRLCVWWDFRW